MATEDPRAEAVPDGITALLKRWRENAEMLAEGNKDEGPDPAVGMQRACADQLEAAVAARSVVPMGHVNDAQLLDELMGACEIQPVMSRVCERGTAACVTRHRAARSVVHPDFCQGCGGRYRFDTTIDSEAWNAVIRANGLPEYLCTACIVREFVTRGQGFTATLWGEEFDGVSITVQIGAARSVVAPREQASAHLGKDFLDAWDKVSDIIEKHPIVSRKTLEAAQAVVAPRVPRVTECQGDCVIRGLNCRPDCTGHPPPPTI